MNSLRQRSLKQSLLSEKSLNEEEEDRHRTGLPLSPADEHVSPSDSCDVFGSKHAVFAVRSTPEAGQVQVCELLPVVLCWSLRE